MTMANYTSGFKDGISIRGVPVAVTHPGKVFWVANNANSTSYNQKGSSDQNDGSFNAPWATLNYAFTQCITNRGDIIMVKSGHAETISTATAMAWGTGDVLVIGLGTGNNRPTFTLDTANTATITVSASNISVQNCIFVANFLAIAALFTLTTAKFFVVSECLIKDTSSSLNFINLVSTSTTSNANDGLKLLNNKYLGLATSGAVKLVSFLGTQDNITIQGNFYQTPTTNSGAVMPIAAGKIVTGLMLKDNYFNLANAAGTATGYLITTNGSTNTGFIDGNKDFALPTTPLPVTLSSGFVYGLNYHTDQADLSGYLLPAADV